MPLEGAAHGGHWVDVGAGLLPTLHRAEGQAQREGGVGVDRRAEGVEARLGDGLALLVGDALDLVLKALAQRARLGIDGAGQHDHRVGRGLDGLLAAVEQLLSLLDVTQLRLRQLARQRLGRLLA